MPKDSYSAALSAFGNAYAGKKVLLTGHTGFKGAWLSEWLLSLDAEVTGYSIDAPEPSLFHQLALGGRLADLRADVRDLSKLSATVASLQPDFIFHLAAQALVRQSYEDPVGTFTTNLTGSVNVMEAARLASHRCVVVMVTTDKCYENHEWLHGYREEDPMGGHDPYSASKGCAELAINAYRRSFFSGKDSRVALASARAGNVIGGGDWAADRIVPDCISALQRQEKIPIRNKTSTRPWQHVLEPLSGYLWLGASLARESNASSRLCSAFNFGPALTSNRKVIDLVEEILKHWPGEWLDQSDPNARHEASLLNLAIDKAFHLLSWQPVWSFEETVAQTVHWYRKAHQLHRPEELLDLTRGQIEKYRCEAAERGLSWATQ
jgi:CDP-glucose 4,6-dehydratase